MRSYHSLAVIVPNPLIGEADLPFEALKVGELAKRTGLTIRTRHHYDEIGLLKPSHHSESGHCLYSGNDVTRLQRIASAMTKRPRGASISQEGTGILGPVVRIDGPFACRFSIADLG